MKRRDASNDIYKAALGLIIGLGCMVYTSVVKAHSPAANVSVSSPLSAVRAYPNPWRSDRHSSDPRVTIDRLVSGSTVKIFTVSGHHVRTLSTSGSSVSWDLNNTSGDRVASGVYLYVVTAPGVEKAAGKITVIR
jgi:hypothetical protein